MDKEKEDSEISLDQIQPALGTAPNSLMSGYLVSTFVMTKIHTVTTYFLAVLNNVEFNVMR